MDHRPLRMRRRALATRLANDCDGIAQLLFRKIGGWPKSQRVATRVREHLTHREPRNQRRGVWRLDGGESRTTIRRNFDQRSGARVEVKSPKSIGNDRRLLLTD